jgi:hypothetical protein
MANTMTKFRFAIATLAIAWMPSLLPAQALPGGEPDTLDEVVVTGRQPGPPLWKISNGERVLWILPLVDIYPKNIDWDSGRVEQLLAGSQEYLYRPRNGVDFSVGDTGLLTLLRGVSAYKKLTHLPRGQKLADLLPADLYRRLLTLRSRYFPAKKISDLTVWEARRVLEEEALDHERLAMLDYSELTSPRIITTKLLKWLNRSKMERRTNTSHLEYVRISSAELKKISKALENVTVSPTAMQLEIACLERAVSFFEKDFAASKRRANAWAQGRADDLLSPRLHTESDSCRSPTLAAAIHGNTELEQYIRDHPALSPDYAVMDRKRRELWIRNAERALATNNKTFGVLSVNDILGAGSLVATLEAKGYKVEVSAQQ